MTASPEEIVREGYTRYGQRDVAGVFELLTDQILITQTTELPWGDEFHGHDGARRLFGLLNQYTEATPEPLEYVAAGDDVAVIGRLKGSVRANGQAIDLAIVHVWTVPDGKITKFAAYIDTPGMLKQLGSA